MRSAKLFWLELNKFSKVQSPLVQRCFLRNFRNSSIVGFSCLVLVAACSSDVGVETVATTDVEVPPSNVLKLEGDVSQVYSNGRFVVWTPKSESLGGIVSISMSPAASATTKAKDSVSSGASSTAAVSMSTSSSPGSAMATPAKASGSSSSMSMSSASSSMSAASISMGGSTNDSMNVIVEAPIENGKFSLTHDVSEIRRVYFYVLDAVSDSGLRMAPVKGQQFILEPGELTLTMDQRARFVVEGGEYNDAVFNSWKLSEEYITANEQYNAMLKEPEAETEDERRAQADARRDQFSKILDLESAGRQHVATTHLDPLARRLTLQTTWLVSGNWYREALEELKELAPDDPWVAMNVERERERAELAAKRDKIAVGTPIVDFAAVDLDGESMTLSQVQADTKIVLLEFWASWCGPCRQEIPNLKKAYENFGDKGFEIVSFTIDDDKEAWMQASEEEELPWINLGMGRESEAATKYTVTGVPYNLLYDAETGTIVSKNLRGHELDVKLEELFM